MIKNKYLIWLKSDAIMSVSEKRKVFTYTHFFGGKLMKRRIAMLLTVVMVASLAACAGGKESTEQGTSGTGTITDKPSADNTPAGDNSEAGETNILVAYFSATNTTEGVAKKIADSLSADLYEIIPEQPYTEEDLDYHDDDSRSSIEMNDDSARPAISGSVEDMEQYSIVFIGYPIWWGEAPRIVSTFMESYDFSGKTIVPFCTSGGSGIGSSATNLEALTSDATWLSGTRLSGGSSRDKIADWVNGLGLNVTAQ